MSASTVTNGSDSRSVSPVPTAIVRTPLRFDCTGIAWAASLIRITSAVRALTRDTWPKMPCASSTAWSLNTPSTEPRSSSTRWRNGSRSTFMIDATITRFATLAEFERISRSRAFSASSASRRCSCRSARRSFAVSSRFSRRSRSRSAKDPVSQPQARPGKSIATCTG